MSAAATSQSRVASSPDWHDVAYVVVLCVVSFILVMSPLLRYFVGFKDYGRYLDFVAAVLLCLRFSDTARHGLPKRGLFFCCAFAAYFLAATLYNYRTDSNFQWTLVFLEGKIFILIAGIYLFQNITIPGEDTRRRLSLVVFMSFVVAIALFVFLPSKDRLTLTDESNYMMIAFLITAVMLIRLWDIRPLSLPWCAICLALVLTSIVARSRTGFALVALVIAVPLIKEYRAKVVLWLPVLVPIGALLATGGVVTFLMRDQTDVTEIDRFVFLEELLVYWWHLTPLEILFKNTVGTYLHQQPLFMEWWVERLSNKHHIPVGLAAFQFHAAYMRLPALIGLLPAVLVFKSIFGILRRSTDTMVIVLLAVAGVSMSIFNLSSVMPYIWLTQMLYVAAPKKAMQT